MHSDDDDGGSDCDEDSDGQLNVVSERCITDADFVVTIIIVCCARVIMFVVSCLVDR